MGSNSNPVKFGPLIFLASYLVRLQNTNTTDLDASTFITIVPKKHSEDEDDFEEE